MAKRVSKIIKDIKEIIDLMNELDPEPNTCKITITLTTEEWEEIIELENKKNLWKSAFEEAYKKYSEVNKKLKKLTKMEEK